MSTDSKHPNAWLTSDSEEMLRALDAIRREVRHAKPAICKPGEPHSTEEKCKLIVAGVLDYYVPEPEALRELRYFLQTRDYDVAHMPLLPGQDSVYYSAISMDDLATMKPILAEVAAKLHDWRLAVTTSDYVVEGEPPYFDIELTRDPQDKRAAKELLFALEQGDAWTDEHDAAAALLGLDPDNFRGNASWSEMEGKVTEPTALRNAIEGKPLYQPREV